MPRLPLLLELPHRALTSDEDNLLILRVQLFGLDIISRLCRLTPAALLVDEVLPHGILERSHPVPDDRVALGRLPQVAGNLADAETSGAAGIALLLLAGGLESRGLVFDALPHTAVPKLGELIRDSADGMGRTDLPVRWQRRLHVRNTNEAI